MPNIYINGTPIPNGASSISYSNPITLSWDGLDSDSYYAQYNTYVGISARDASNTYADLSFSGNTGVSDPTYAYFDRYGDISDYSSWAGYMQVWSSGSVSIYNFVGICYYFTKLTVPKGSKSSGDTPVRKNSPKKK